MAKASVEFEAIKVAMFDVKSYEKLPFDQAVKERNLNNTFQFVYLEPRLSISTASFAAGCDAVCCFVNDDLSGDVLVELADMQISLVLMRCAGYDKVNLQLCQALGIIVVNVPAYSPYAVAEFAMAHLLTLNRKLHRSFNRVRNGNFTISGLVGFDLYGKTVGVIGTGKIGQCFIDIAIGFGCKVICFDLYPNDNVRQKRNTTYVTLDELYAAADIISIHVPMMAENYHMINKSSLSKMKKGVIIINTSRGGLIDAEALVESLVSGHIGGAGLDVYENEGNFFFRDCSDVEISDGTLARLTNMRNVIVTSHQAFLTEEALKAISNTTLTNLDEFYIKELRERQLKNYVAPPTPAAAAASIERKSLGLHNVVGSYARRKTLAASARAGAEEFAQSESPASTVASPSSLVAAMGEAAATDF